MKRYVNGVDFGFDIRVDQPPNIEQIKENFPLQGYEIFAFEHVIYNPNALDLPNEILMHELVHFGQQQNESQAWWDEYCANAKFRLQMEQEAHIAEWKWKCKPEKNREVRAQYRMMIARKLCSGIYGKDFCTMQTALKCIK